MLQEFNFDSPATLEEACRLLAETGGRPIAGGTDVIPQMRDGRFQAGHLIDLGRLDDLNYIKQIEGRIVIGGLTTFRSLLDSELLEEASARSRAGRGACRRRANTRTGDSGRQYRQRFPGRGHAAPSAGSRCPDNAHFRRRPTTPPSGRVPGWPGENPPPAKRTDPGDLALQQHPRAAILYSCAWVTGGAWLSPLSASPPTCALARTTKSKRCASPSAPLRPRPCAAPRANPFCAAGSLRLTQSTKLPIRRLESVRPLMMYAPLLLTGVTVCTSSCAAASAL